MDMNKLELDAIAKAKGLDRLIHRHPRTSVIVTAVVALVLGGLLF